MTKPKPFIPAAPGTPLRRQQDLEMMRSPDRWPLWPRLPLKRSSREHTRSHGYLANTSLTDDTVIPKVYTRFIFQDHDSDEFIEYKSMEALVDAGWTVD